MTDSTFNSLHPSIKKLVLLLNDNRLKEYHILIQSWCGTRTMLNWVIRAMDRVDDDIVWFESRYEVHSELTSSRRLFMQLNKIRVDLQDNWPIEQNESGSEQRRISVPS